MFTSFDMKGFGAVLRSIRESHNLTRGQVLEHLGLHPDTLRKIELGTVIPKYESLEMLSQLYNVDLLNILRIHRCNANLENIYESLDNFLINDKIENILELKNQLYNDPNKFKLLFQDEYFLLKLLIDIVITFHENKSSDLIEMVSKLEQHIDVNALQNINLNQISSPLITRISNVLAMTHMKLTNYESSIFIFISILEIVKTDTMGLYSSFKLEIKYCYSISYSYFLQSDYIESLHYSDQGIDIALKNQSLYMLYNLYSRKGASEFKLEIDTYKDSFVKCIHLVDMLGDDSLTLSSRAQYWRQLYMLLLDSVKWTIVEIWIEFPPLSSRASHYHSKGENEAVVSTVDQCLNNVKVNYTRIALSHLLFRKGLALYLLNEPNGKSLLYTSLSLMDTNIQIQMNTVLRENYDLDLSNPIWANKKWPNQQLRWFLLIDKY